MTESRIETLSKCLQVPLHGYEFIVHVWAENVPFRYILTSHEPTFLQVYYENIWGHEKFIRARYEYEIDFHLEKAVDYLYEDYNLPGKRAAEEVWSTIHLFLRCQGATLFGKHWTRFNELQEQLNMPAWKTNPLGHSLSDLCAPEYLKNEKALKQWMLSKQITGSLKPEEIQAGDTLYLLFHWSSGLPYTIMSGSELCKLKTLATVSIIASEKIAFNYNILPRTLCEMEDLMSRLIMDSDSDSPIDFHFNDKNLSLGIVPILTVKSKLAPLKSSLYRRIPDDKGLEYFLLTRKSDVMQFQDFIVKSLPL